MKISSDLHATLKEVNHYAFIEKYGKVFTEAVGLKHCKNIAFNLSCDGDKTRQYKYEWETYGVPFVFGTMIYLLSKEMEFRDQIRDTDDGWVSPVDWVITVYRSDDTKPEYKNIKEGIKAVLSEMEKDKSLNEQRADI